MSDTWSKPVMGFVSVAEGEIVRLKGKSLRKLLRGVQVRKNGDDPRFIPCAPPKG